MDNFAVLTFWRIVVTLIMAQISDYPIYWNMVQVFVKNFWKKLVGRVLAIENTCIGRFIFLMVLSVIAVHLECNKINYQRQVGYCKEMDSFKCENGGIRIYSKENGVSCWCTPDYVGEHCQKPASFMSRAVSLFLLPSSQDISRGRPTMWWSIFPFTSRFQLKNIYAFHQSAVERLENVFAGANNGGYGPRILPPACPLECCANDKTLPTVKTLYNKILKWKPGQFIPDRKNSNLLLDAFYQYFVLQFLDANSNLTVTASQLYGSGTVSERSKRSLSGGKLKTQEFNFKHFATNHAFAPYSDVYLKALTKGISTDNSWLSRMIPWQFKRPQMSSTSMFYVMSLIWAHEHNRVCDELSQKWPLWTDEEVYTQARKIVTGQMMNIMMTEILNVELRPEVAHKYRGSGKPIELYLTMAVSDLPEKLQYSSKKLTSYSQDSEADLKDIVTTNDDGPLTLPFTKALMTLSREQCFQSFNNYRRRLGLPAYNSFFDLTGNIETATELEKLYSTVEKVEFLTGVLTEKTSSGGLPTAKVLSNSFIVNAILTNRLTTKHMWAPDTFGGAEFFNLVKSTSLESLMSRNVDNFDELNVHRYAKYLIHQSAVERLENGLAGSNNGGYGSRILPPASQLYGSGAASERSKNSSFVCRNVDNCAELKVDRYAKYLIHQSAVKSLENSLAGSNNGGHGPRILPSASLLYGRGAASKRSKNSSLVCRYVDNFDELKVDRHAKYLNATYAGIFFIVLSVIVAYYMVYNEKVHQSTVERLEKNVLANSNNSLYGPRILPPASQLYGSGAASERSNIWSLVCRNVGNFDELKVDRYAKYLIHQSAVEILENVFAGANNGGYGPRILTPACSLESCANDKTLLPLKTLYNKMLKWKRNEMFYQYFVLQFSDANSNLTITASQLYISDCASEGSKRWFTGTKLKIRQFNYKYFAMNHAFAPCSDVHLKVLTKGISTDNSCVRNTFLQYSCRNVDNCYELKVDRYAKYLIHQSTVERLENVLANSNNGGHGPRILPSGSQLYGNGAASEGSKIWSLVCRNVDNFDELKVDRYAKYLIHQSTVERLENVLANSNNGGHGSRILPSASQLYGNGAASESSKIWSLVCRNVDNFDELKVDRYAKYLIHQSAVESLENSLAGSNNGGHGPRILPSASLLYGRGAASKRSKNSSLVCRNVDNCAELKVDRFAKYLNATCAGIFFTVLSVLVVHRYAK